MVPGVLASSGMPMCIPTRVKTILIVDEDLGFAFWLGGLLNAAGYQVWPARSGADAGDLLKELHSQPDLVVVNPKSCGAIAFVDEQKQRAHFKVMLIQAQDEPYAEFTGADATVVKTQGTDEVSGFEWVGLIERLFAKSEQQISQPTQSRPDVPI